MNSNKRKTKKKMEENAPTLSHEQYLEVVSLKNTVINLRSQGYNFMKQKEAYEKELKNLEEVLKNVDFEVEKNDTAFVSKMREYTEKHGFANTIAVADTEPHYITEVPSENLSNPDLNSNDL